MGVIYIDGIPEELINDLDNYTGRNIHREDGPAIIWTSGTKEWRVNGKRHRKDGPAVEYFNGSKVWYQNGKLHRVDGPAVEYFNGFGVWYLKGKHYNFEDFLKQLPEEEAILTALTYKT
jgi:hypothetical protein